MRRQDREAGMGRSGGHGSANEREDIRPADREQQPDQHEQVRGGAPSPDQQTPPRERQSGRLPLPD